MKPRHRENQQEKASNVKLGKDSGRVKVFVRVRPPRPHESSRKDLIAVNVEELSSQIHVSDPKHSWEKTFNFDHVFPKESTNQEVCSTISRPLVNAALNGFNGTLMAYGQTGSGKTHTLMAPDGITAGVIERCFKKITQDDLHDFKVTMSYLQIYQEKIYDLLNSTSKVELSLREHPVKGVYVENLSEFVVRSPSEVLSLLAVGKKRLIFAETKMNRNSSRSHSVCQLTIERTRNKNKVQTEGNSKAASSQVPDPKEGTRDEGDKSTEGMEDGVSGGMAEGEGADTEDDSLAKMAAFNDDVLIRGRIYLCDLAGSERLKKTQAEGERLSEALHINSSLLELGNVIQALAEGKKTHVPFRNSTLTRLLQESLGGNCKTSLVVCVSPTITDVSETKSALFFGSRAMKITNTAYINVEVDYKRLSEDLSKIVDMKDKSLEELKQSYEHRIERMKQEAETAVKNAMAEADKVAASVKNLLQNQQSTLQSDIENLNSSLEEERARSEVLQCEITAAKCKLEEDMFRAKTSLLMDIISMQLFYAIKDLSPDFAPVLQGSELRLKTMDNGTTKSKLLENADLLLEVFKGHLNMMNSKGEKMLENSGSLRFLLGSEDPLEERTLLRDTEDLSLYLTNKTDDDKVVASTRCDETPCESHQEVISPISGEMVHQNGEYTEIRDKLVSLKDSVDGEALDFLKRAFEFNPENNDQAKGTRKEIYERIQDIVQTRESVSDAQNSPELPRLADSLALLDHCHSHVIIDKALQSALLVLENNNVIRRCHDIQKQKNVLEDENETLKKQIQSLKNEAEKLNGKLGETSTVLTVVKKSKERLEDDLSSVFQLYNMRNGERNENEEIGMENAPSPERLHAQISSLAEDNEKLREELAVKEQEKDDLECELTSVKEELRREKERHFQAQQDDTSVQTESKEQKESANPSHGECSVDFEDFEVIHGILSSLHEDYSFSLETAASAAQSNNSVDVSSLRAVINKRLGEEWSLLVLENARMKSELDNIRSRINEEKRSFFSKLTKLQENPDNEKEPHVDDGAGFTDKIWFTDDGGSDVGSEQQMLEIMVYGQNKVIAKLEMDKQEVVKGLQRYKVDSDKNDNEEACGGRVGVSNNQLTKEDLEAVFNEQFQHISTVQQNNESLEKELDLLRARYKSLEQSYEDSSKSNESLEERLTTMEEREKNLCAEIEQMKERCSELNKQLLHMTIENNNLKEGIKDLESKVFEVEQESYAIKEEWETLCEERVNVEHELASERDQKNIFKKRLQEKTEQFEEESRLRQLKENFLSKVEKELAEAKESSNQLLECVNHLEAERNDMMKEINSLRYLQGLPTVKRAVNKAEATSKQRSLQYNGREKRVQNRKNNKLNSELMRAKEQLVRLKAELTLSNMQTRNLGTQLSSLREDSTKLEAELSTVRLSPKNSRQRCISFSCYDETVRLEIELGDAKERIIDLQEKLLVVYKEKFSLEEKIQSFDDQAKRETHSGLQSAMQETERDAKDFEDDNKTQEISLDQRKQFENKIHVLETEKAQLKKDLENANADKTRLEEIEYYLQQLVTLEDEQMKLKSRLKMWAQSGGDEQHISEANDDGAASPRKKADSNKTTDNIFLHELKALCAENDALQEEADILKETVADLESDLTTIKLKLSMKENFQETALDKKAAAALLVSAKQERAELRKELDNVINERDDLEEELSDIKIKYARIQREFAMTSMVKDDLELEILSLRKMSLSRGLSDLTQSNEEHLSQISDSSNEDPLTFYGDGVVEEKGDLRGQGDNTENSKKPSSTARINEKKPLQPRPTSLLGFKSTMKKETKRRTLPPEPTREKLDSGAARFNTGHNQPEMTYTEHQGEAITYNLINIDDVDTDEMRAGDNYNDSGLLRETPKGEREKPEGMEQEGYRNDKTGTIAKDNRSDTLLDDSVECDERWSPFQGIVGAESVVAQSAEVLVKSAWCIKNLFKRQKSLPIPDHDFGALKQ